MTHEASLSAATDTPSTSTIAEQGNSGANTVDLSRWSEEEMHADFTRLIGRLSAASGGQRTRVLLDFAELMMSHMLLQEAAEILEGLSPEDPEQARRLRALQDARALLRGEAVDLETSPLVVERVDASFWRSLQAIATKDIPMLQAALPEGFAGLYIQSTATIYQMLPAFTEAAIELGFTDHADLALKVLDGFPDLAQGATGLYLRGRAAEKKGNQSSALKAYLEAVEHWDRWAARARIAIADMSLRDRSEGALLAAQGILEEGVEAWRGDRFESEVLTRLLLVYEANGNEVESLLTIGKILRRFPRSPDAAELQSDADRLLTRIYSQGAEGAFTISAFLEAHLRLLPHFKNHPDFPAKTAQLAGYVQSLGATDLAVTEFERASRLLRQREPIPTGALIENDMRLAEVLMQANRPEETLELLDELALLADEAQQSRISKIRVDALSAANDRRGLIQATIAEPHKDYLRALTRAHFEEENWEQSVQTSLDFWHRFPQNFGTSDATYLLIAANRSENSQIATRVIEAFPSISGSDAISELAEGIGRDKTPIIPLNRQSAEGRLEELETAFEVIRRSQAERPEPGD